VTETVIYAAGTLLPSSQNVNIPTIQDNMLEGDHSFTVTITGTSAVPGATVSIGAQFIQTVVIDDDESE